MVNLAKPDDGTEVVDGPEEVNASADVGGPKADGSDVVNLVEDHGTVNTPAFVKREYWITSARSSSGCKGVSKCTRCEGWRAKAEDSTIGRFDTKAEACEAYYT